ncbi:hypothetical protein BDQ17DRAFT_1433818 [Cyathus striatus]|nr:hypothetical protein BDQ17DRAFT_1433818 [Cyathus striatus]
MESISRSLVNAAEIVIKRSVAMVQYRYCFCAGSHASSHGAPTLIAAMPPESHPAKVLSSENSPATSAP